MTLTCKKLFSFLAVLMLCFSTNAFAKKAPSFNLDGDNGKISLSQFKNQVVYVDFWASWCKPCRKSFKFMNNMQKRYGKKGLKIIAINLDDDRKTAETFLKSNPANFTIAYDQSGSTPEAYNLSVMPTSYLIDRKGNIVMTHKGFKKDQVKQLEKKIIQTLKKR